ncbi:hypothetical protein ElyMa_004832500 [Elysia marginata]|uniref:Uncharacterized protein n=1 Tax=Elysia marginata TaxID=1093978 RepID=A0AAV4ILV3_9GAST|nr:hypothetical protein ElyMa_004832500 [Elysia marginata]
MLRQTDLKSHPSFTHSLTPCLPPTHTHTDTHDGIAPRDTVNPSGDFSRLCFQTRPYINHLQKRGDLVTATTQSHSERTRFVHYRQHDGTTAARPVFSYRYPAHNGAAQARLLPHRPEMLNRRKREGRGGVRLVQSRGRHGSVGYSKTSNNINNNISNNKYSSNNINNNNSSNSSNSSNRNNNNNINSNSNNNNHNNKIRITTRSVV